MKCGGGNGTDVEPSPPLSHCFYSSQRCKPRQPTSVMGRPLPLHASASPWCIIRDPISDSSSQLPNRQMMRGRSTKSSTVHYRHRLRPKPPGPALPRAGPPRPLEDHHPCRGTAAGEGDERRGAGSPAAGAGGNLRWWFALGCGADRRGWTADDPRLGAALQFPQPGRADRRQGAGQ